MVEQYSQRKLNALGMGNASSHNQDISKYISKIDEILIYLVNWENSSIIKMLHEILVLEKSISLIPYILKKSSRK